VAKEVGATLAQFSIAWCASNKHVSTVILGATSTAQLDENLKALEFIDKITPEIRAKVDAIVQFKPVVLEQAEPIVHHLRTEWL
ncbi:K+ channel protein, partial [Globisporangium polare]